MTDPQARAAAESRAPSKSWYYRCQEFVRKMLGLPGGAGSASESYRENVARGTIHTGRAVPVNVPVYFDTGRAAGHVGLSDGRGNVWSTDIRRKGQVDLVPITEIESKWGARYLGWGTYVNGTNLPVDPTSAAGAVGVGFVPDVPGPVDDYVDKKLQAGAKATAGGVVDTVKTVIVDPFVHVFGDFAIKAGFVGLGLALVTAGAVSLSRAPTRAVARKAGLIPGAAT